MPGDLLFAFVVAADPFEFAVFGPVGGRLGGGGEFDGCVGYTREQLLDGCEVGFAPFERCGAVACGAAVGVDVPGVDAVEVEVGDVERANFGVRVDGGEVGGDGVAVDADGVGARRCFRLAELGRGGRRRCRSRGRRSLWSRRPLGRDG